MVRRLLPLTLTLYIAIISFFSHAQKLGFEEVLNDEPYTPTTFCVPNSLATIELLQKENIQVKYSAGNWLFITTTPQWINDKTRSEELSDFYFEFAPPAMMGDSARFYHHVDPVLNGLGGLNQAYTGQDVIIGYVDTGIDFNHPDFKDAAGNTRVLRYWDHTLNTGNAPAPYGYGTVWDSTAINNGSCTSLDNHSHGTTVAGQGSGNALANGTQMGVAPNSDIVIVESNFGASNWSLTIADACDYIFKVADTLGKPAVINLSIGSYLGSHDGNDPAAEAIEAMLDAKDGRVVVAAAGNSGYQPAYHVHNDVNTDTTFTWFKNNPSGAFGANKIFFDLWSDASAATFNFAFAADKPSPDYDLRGTTSFHGATSSIGSVIYDTIWNGTNRIATMRVFTSIVGSNYNMQVLFDDVDSTDYLFRFMTTGSGSYDLWSGAWQDLNDIESNIPTTAQMPAIANYILPDTLQSIVSSWNCSEKVISVGNMGNRTGYNLCNGGYYTTNPVPIPGKLAVSSSKGPNRHNLVKPDISAAGEVSLCTAPMWFVNNPAVYCIGLDTAGYHSRNGGTSIAAPVIAGIAALYLEHCGTASYQDFFSDLTSTAYTDNFTGTVPNNGYGYGKAHALDLLLSTEYTATVTGPAGLCDEPIDLSVSAPFPIEEALWSDGSTNVINTINAVGSYSASVVDSRGCPAETDTLDIVQFIVPTISPITQNGNVLSTTASDTYQWTLDGNDIAGATNPTLTITPPYGTYTCYTVSSDGCIAETDSVVITASLDDISMIDLSIYPNPVDSKFTVQTTNQIKNITAISTDGKQIQLNVENGNEVNTQQLAKGVYQLVIETDKGSFTTKISKM